MACGENYFNYLQQRNWTGALYRKLWLYPRMASYLKGSVLDIGCGVGDFLSYRKNTTGVDINPHAVQWCRGKGFKAKLMAQDQLPFSDRIFDGATLDNVIEHIIDPGPLLTEAHRVLRDPANLVVGVPGPRGFDHDPDHKVFYSKNGLIDVVTRHGFKIQTVFTMPLNFKFLESRLSQYCIYGVFKKIADDV